MICTKCHKEKSEELFYRRKDKSNIGGRKLFNSQCIECKNKYGREYNKDKDRKRIIRQKSLYKLTDEQVERYKNSKTCDVCGVECKTFIDHDHASGKIRGFVCQHCNLTLGMARDDISILEKIIVYLKGYS